MRSFRRFDGSGIFLRQIDGNNRLGTTPQFLQDLPGLFQKEILEGSFGSRVGFASALTAYLDQHYDQPDKPRIYRQVLNLAIEADQKLP